jgi:iron complex outermembrane receptor protein
VKYDIDGFRENPDLFIKNDYNFFNPKFGVSYNYKDWSGYLSYGIARKEPNRDDFEAGENQQPLPEKLNDFELGVEQKKDRCNFGATLYYMKYKDQLVLTGKINDVGAYTRTNIPESYRVGVELQGNIQPENWLKAGANLTLSKNKLNHFTEYIDDYDNGGQKINNYTSTDIALSPAIVGAANITFLPCNNFELSLLGKYVSKQYLDNTQNEGRKLDPYYVQDARLIYSVHRGFLKEANIIFQLNNILNEKYEPNGYTYNYISGGELSVNNYYFPMAGINFMLGVNLRF